MSKKPLPYNIVQSVDRAFSVFGLFILKRKPLGITEIAQELELHTSVVHRLLSTMEAHHFVEQLSDSSKYQIGPKAFELGAVYMNNSLIMEGKRFLPELANKTGKMAHLGILHEETVLYLVNQVPHESIRMLPQVGIRKPVSSTAAGKILLAWLDEEQVSTLIKNQGLSISTPNSIRTIDEFFTELVKVREQGYAVDNHEMAMDFQCVAVPVRDNTGNVIAAISIGGRKISLDSMDEIVDILLSYSEAISERLGYLPSQFI